MSKPSVLTAGRPLRAGRPRRPVGPALTVRSPADLVAVVPHLLGFAPADSLVLVFASPAGVELTARLDNADLLARPPAGLLADLWERGRAAGGQRVLALVYGPWRRAQRVGRLAKAALRPWLELLLIVDGERWWHADDRLRDGGAPTSADRPISAAAGQAGLSVAPSRAAVAAAWAPPRGSREDDLIALRQEVSEHLAATDPADWPGLMDGLAEQLESADADFSDVDYVTAALLAADPAARIRLWRRLGPATARAHLRFWTEAARRCPVGGRLVPVAVLGLAAWQAGEGVVMALCHDEAAALDPADPAVQLLATVRERLLPPAAWAAAAGHGDADGTSGFDLEG